MKIKAHVQLPCEMLIPSYNFLFHPSIRGGKPHLYKDERVVKFQRYLIGELGQNNELIRLASVHKIIPLIIVRASFVFAFKERFFGRDTSNAIKATEDALVQVIGIDDSQFISVQGEKVRSDDNNIEKVSIELIPACKNIYCKCGCGGMVTLCHAVKGRLGIKKWEPLPYIRGHNIKQKTPAL